MTPILESLVAYATVLLGVLIRKLEELPSFHLQKLGGPEVVRRHLGA